MLNSETFGAAECELLLTSVQARALFGVYRAADDCNSRYALGAVQLSSESTGELTSAATDGRRLYHCTFSIAAGKLDVPKLVELKLAKRLGAIPKSAGNVLLQFNRQGACRAAWTLKRGKNRNVELFGVPVDGRFPQWRELLWNVDTQGAGTLSGNVQNFVSAFTLPQSVNVEYEGKRCHVASESENAQHLELCGRFVETLNAQFVLDFCADLPETLEMRAHTRGNGEAITLHAGARKALVMPLARN